MSGKQQTKSPKTRNSKERNKQLWHTRMGN